MNRGTNMTKSLRAADLGYTWPEWLPDGATWTRNKCGRVILFHNSAVERHDEKWLCKDGNATLVEEDRDWLGLTPPDFGDRHWQECILIKGHEPELPPCPPGDGWIEWSGGECPASGRVTLQFRDGSLQESENAQGWSWGHWSRDSDIIRYRVHQPKYRPYSDQEMRQRVYEEHYVCMQNGERGGMISGWQRSATSEEILVRICGMWYGAPALLAEWQYRDGSPCGVEVSDGN